MFVKVCNRGLVLMDIYGTFDPVSDLRLPTFILFILTLSCVRTEARSVSFCLTERKVQIS